MFEKCKPLITAPIDSSHSYTNSSIDLRLTFVYRHIDLRPAVTAQCVVCAKNTAGFRLNRTDLLPFIYFGYAAMYFLYLLKSCQGSSFMLTTKDVF